MCPLMQPFLGRERVGNDGSGGANSRLLQHNQFWILPSEGTGTTNILSALVKRGSGFGRGKPQAIKTSVVES